jgi:hypothetical protein
LNSPTGTMSSATLMARMTKLWARLGPNSILKTVLN